MASTLNKLRDTHARGQVIILLTLVFVALIAFLGIVIDGGVVLTRYAQLRRTVDAAAVQASNQFREFRPVYAPSNPDGDMYRSAIQVAASQGFIATGPGANATFWVYACTGSGPSIESGPPQSPADYPAGLTAQLCTTPPRKLVRVDGEINVGFAFLSVLGWRNVTLRATGTAEAAALDLVLVLDRSSSMAADTGDPTVCGPAKTCQPFEQVRSNAYNLVNKLYFPYDRVALVAFSRKVLIYDHSLGSFRTLSGITDTAFLNGQLLISDKGEALSVLNDNAQFKIDTCLPPACLDNNMPGTGYTANTNTGGAIRVATSALAVQGRLRGAVWMMLLLSDGTPNTTDPWGQFTGGFCPPNTWAYGQTYTVPGYLANTAPSFPYAHSYCRRVNVSDGGIAAADPDLPFNQITRACLYVPPYPGGPLPKCAPGTTITDTARIVSLADPPYYPRYDAADYMRDQADYMSANGIVAFVIGLGNEVSNNSRQWSTYKWIVSGGAIQNSREINAGERLLRYVADVGSQPNTWQCHSNYWYVDDRGNRQTEFVNTTPDHHCGNYWYAASGSSLQPIFDAIANRIFTRITQ